MNNKVSCYGTRKSSSTGDNNAIKNASIPAAGRILQKAGKPLYLAKSTIKDTSNVNIRTGKNTSPNQFSAQRLINVKQAVNGIKSLSTSVTAGSKNPGRNKNDVVTFMAEVGIPLSQGWLDSGTQNKSDHVVKGKPNHVNGIQMSSFTQPKKMDNTIFRNGSIKNRLPKNLVRGNGARPVQQKMFANNIGQRKFSLKGGNSLPSDGLHSFLAEVHSSNTKPHLGINDDKYIKSIRFKNMTSEQVHRMNQTNKQNKNGFQATMSNYSPERNVGRQKDPLKGNMQSLMVQNKPIKQGVFIDKNQGSGNAKPGGYGAKANANHFNDNNGRGRFGNFREVNNGKHVTVLGKPLLNMKEKNMTTDHGLNIKENKGTQNKNLQQHYEQTNFNNGYSGFFGGLNSAFSPGQVVRPNDEALQFKKPYQAQDEYVEEYDIGDKPVVTAFNQRYVPVDDFGLPFYGKETG